MARGTGRGFAPGAARGRLSSRGIAAAISRARAKLIAAATYSVTSSPKKETNA